ncbi:hypothetical protein [Streptomyces sp. ISL-98]|uniref:hypothetical protein n=1 Tax=Streptomyces sp. ISL-98 TaxID=2819192 RepID=UPI00203513AC|nr:hypothetical protein [Streptomyces sp. ISL-98]
MLDRKGAGGRFITSCFLKAVDDRSLEKLFFTTVRNFLIDEAKMTDRGKLRRRFARRLQEDDRFLKVTGPSPRWALAAGTRGQVWQGDLDTLVRAAWEVRGVWITAWNHSGPTPVETVQALMTVLTAVLEAAGGAVREEDLARVLEARFDLLAPPEYTTLYADDGALIDPTVAAADLGSVADRDPVFADVRAEWIWQALSPQERILLSYLEDSPAAAAGILQSGPRQAGAIMEAIREKLRLALSDDSDQVAVLGALLNRGGDPPDVG